MRLAASKGSKVASKVGNSQVMWRKSQVKERVASNVMKVASKEGELASKVEKVASKIERVASEERVASKGGELASKVAKVASNERKLASKTTKTKEQPSPHPSHLHKTLSDAKVFLLFFKRYNIRSHNFYNI